MREIWSRTKRLIGEKGLDTLSQSHVAVVGLGGVGGAAAEALARAGVGKLTLFDNDIVQPSNINRQLIALQSTVGKFKTEVLAARLRDIAPDIELRLITHLYLPDDDGGLFEAPLDAVVDAIDNMTAKLDLIKNCHRRQIPLISSLGMGNRLAPELITITDLAKTHTDPLARIMRKKLSEAKIRHLPVVFSSESPLTPEPETQNEATADVAIKGKNPPASISFVPPVAGYMAASYIVRHLLKANG